MLKVDPKTFGGIFQSVLYDSAKTVVDEFYSCDSSRLTECLVEKYQPNASASEYPQSQ